MTSTEGLVHASTDLIAERITWAVDDLAIELPSWGFANTGTRFAVFPQLGVPRDTFEKVDDAATVAKYTGVARSVALHIPWDGIEGLGELSEYAAQRNLVIGAINSNTFQDHDYMLGALCHPSAEVRAKAVAAIVRCCEIAGETSSKLVKVWLSDGTNYPGQDDLRARRHRLVEGLRQVHEHLPEGTGMLLEYKFYEPAFYSTDVQDWGQALSVCRLVGEKASVCVDTGHHAMGVNIEQIVAALLAEGMLGGFDLNDKKYGDDDLMVGSIDPFQLFRIAHELVNAMRDDDDPVAQRTANQTVYMLDQCHNIEAKLPAIIRSVMNLQEIFAKALLVDREALLAAQAEGDVLEANRVFNDAYATDVRAALSQLRLERGLPADPYRAYLESGEQAQREAGRVGGAAASWT